MTALGGQRAKLLRSWVKRAEVLVEVELEALCDDPEWQEEEILAAYRRMERQTQDAIAVLMGCANISHLKLQFDHDDGDWKKKSHARNSHTYSRPMFNSGGLLQLPFFANLQSLCLSGPDASTFDLEALAGTLSHLQQLSSLELVEFESWSTLVTCLAATNRHATLQNLSWKPNMAVMHPASLLKMLHPMSSVTTFTWDCFATDPEEAWGALQYCTFQGRPINSVLSFRLLHLTRMQEYDLSAIANTFPAVQHLHFSLIHIGLGGSDELSISLLVPFPHLQSLSIHIEAWFGNAARQEEAISWMLQVIRVFASTVDAPRFPILRRFHITVEVGGDVHSDALEPFFIAVGDGAVNMLAHVKADVLVQVSSGATSRTFRQ